MDNVDVELHGLINENHSDSQLLRHYIDSAKETPEADSKRPIEILRNAGAIFKESAVKSIEDISAFHAQIYRNRKSFLDGEITKLRADIRNRKKLINDLAQQKEDLLRILNKSGALENLIEIQKRLSEVTGELEALKTRIDERKKFDRRKDEKTREIADVRTLLKSDLEDRQETVDEARALFARYTNHLYGQAVLAQVEEDAANPHHFPTGLFVLVAWQCPDSVSVHGEECRFLPLFGQAPDLPERMSSAIQARAVSCWRKIHNAEAQNTGL